jgi:hypothetical protein
MWLQTVSLFSKVGDAMTLIFTNPLFTMIFAAIFLGHRLTLIKNLSGNAVFPIAIFNLGFFGFSGFYVFFFSFSFYSLGGGTLGVLDVLSVLGVLGVFWD